MSRTSAVRAEAEVGEVTADRDTVGRVASELRARQASAVRWASIATIVATVVLLVISLWRTGGTFVYVLDDPAIHLTVARRLIFDGTWGVVAGAFQSASTSPLWTVILAPTQWIVRGRTGEVVPAILNVVAALWVIRLLGADLRALRSSSSGPLGAAATVAIPVLLLFLPGLVFTGMEHTLHMALVLATVFAVERRWVIPGADETSGRRSALAWFVPFALVGLATWTRGESAFVALGLAVGLVVVGLPGFRDPGSPSPTPWPVRLWAGIGLGVASGLALATIAAVNLAHGQELLPNSTVVKTFGDRSDTRRTLGAAFDRLTTDPLLAALFAMAIVVVVLARTGVCRPALFPAIVMVVSTGMHVELAAVELSVRYEAYLVALGVLVAIRAASRPAADGPAWRRAPAALVVLLLVPFATLQARRTWSVPDNSAITWEQRYQVARFLGSAYEHDAIAIGELGYIGLYHDGPLTDVYGLGDHEVVEATLDDRKDAAFWRQLQAERGFRVVATYDFALAGQVPEEWFSVADWRSPDAYYEVTRFLATAPEEVDPLLRALRRFEDDLPAGVEVRYNPLVGFAAAARMEEEGSG